MKTKIDKKIPKINKRWKNKIRITILNIIILFNLSKCFIDSHFPQGRIFVCFSYNNEAEMAYIHVWRLYNYVDKFIFCISNITHSGLQKNFSFEPYELNLKQYENKIDIAIFDNICNKNEYHSDNLDWCYEKSQRDFAKTYIEQHYNPTRKDLLIIVDIDEILTKEGIEYIINHPPKHYYFIKGSMYFPYYYHKVEDWNKGCVVRYKKSMKTLSKYRLSYQSYNLLQYKKNPNKPLITHCSYCFDSIEKYKNKLKSFAHQEYNKYPYITNNWIFKSHYCRKKINSPSGNDEPIEGWRHLIPDDKRLKYLVDPSFMLPLNKTTYTENDLNLMCDRKFRRKPF